MHAKDVKSFNLGAFKVTHPNLDINRFVVGIPKQPFRIIDADIDLFHIAYLDDRWWLVSEEIATATKAKYLYQAELYLYQLEDGTLGVLPVTIPKPGYTHSWYEAWQTIVRVAKRNWITVSHRQDLYQHEYKVVRRLESCDVPDISVDEWLSRAFGLHFINDPRHVMAKKYLSPRPCYFPEEDECF